jgi:hypothetical protein
MIEQFVAGCVAFSESCKPILAAVSMTCGYSRRHDFAKAAIVSRTISALIAAPTFGECRHSGLTRRLVAAGRRAVSVVE